MVKYLVPRCPMPGQGLPLGGLLARTRLVLFFTMFLVMLGFGIIIPILPFYVVSFGATSLHLGLLMSTFSLVQLIFAPIWGNLSDRIGRKPLIAIGVAGYALSYLIMAYANGIAMLFVARFIGGMLSSATIPTAQAYVADTTSIAERGKGMAMMGAAMGMGMIFGPAVGGLLGAYGLAVPLLFGAALAALNLVSVLIFLREPPRQPATRSQDRKPYRLRDAITALRGPLAFFFVITALIAFAMGNLQSTFSLYAQARLGFGATDMGVIFTAMGISGALMQGAVVGRAIQRFGEERVIQAGFLFTVAGFLLILTAGDLVTLTLFAVLQNMGDSLTRPSLASLLSKRTEAGQGATLGLQTSFDSLGRIAGPAWGGLVFQSSPSYPYLTGAAIVLTVFAASMPRCRRSAAAALAPSRR